MCPITNTSIAELLEVNSAYIGVLVGVILSLAGTVELVRKLILTSLMLGANTGRGESSELYY